MIAPAWARLRAALAQGHAGWTLGALALWLLATSGIRPLLLPDEGRYAEVAREMWRAGNLIEALVPRLNGLPFFHKPPLTYWVDMAGLALTGATPWAARLGPALGAWLMGAALWALLRRWRGVATAHRALLLLATTPLAFIGGQYANHDMLVAGCITLAVCAFAQALRGGAPERRWLLAGWAACALSVLAKGLIGLVLPGLVIGAWLLLQGRWRHLLALLHPAGLAVFALIALPWYALMQLRYPAFFDYFIVEQHFRRYAQSGFNNAQPPWFFVAVLPLLTLPWSAWLWPAASATVARLRGPSAGASGMAPGPAHAAEGDRLTLLLAVWVVGVVGFFSLPTSKLVGYVLPALAPWCALLALAFADGRHPRGLRRTALGAAALCVALLVPLTLRAPHSGADVAASLRRAAQPGDQLVLVEEPFHDISYLADLPLRERIATDWDDPELPRRDNWRKELADAARFDPAAAAERLLRLKDLPATVQRLRCAGQRVWLVAEPHQAAPVRALPAVQLVLEGRHQQLWRADPLVCTAAPG